MLPTDLRAHEQSECACVDWEARDCYCMRYGLFTSEDRDNDDGKCECPCHAELAERAPHVLMPTPELI